MVMIFFVQVVFAIYFILVFSIFTLFGCSDAKKAKTSTLPPAAPKKVVMKRPTPKMKSPSGKANAKAQPASPKTPKEKSLRLDRAQSFEKNSGKALKDLSNQEATEAPKDIKNAAQTKETSPIFPLERIQKKGLLDDYVEKAKLERDKDVEAMQIEESKKSIRREQANAKVTFNDKKCELWETKQQDTLDDEVQEEDQE